MKCTACHAAEPIIKYRGEVPYWYKGHTTSIQGVNQYVCPRCGNESVPPGYVQLWLERTASFRAEVDVQEPGLGVRPVSPKDKIMVEWLTLDPDQLAADVPIEEDAYVRWETLASYAKQHQNAAFEALVDIRVRTRRIDQGARIETIGWSSSMHCARRGQSLPILIGRRRMTV